MTVLPENTQIGTWPAIYLALILFVYSQPCIFAVEFDPFATEQTNGRSADTYFREDSSDEGPTIPEIQFTNNDISMAFQIISDSTGWSIFPTAEVSRAKISLWAKNISASKLLNTVVELAGFVYYRNGNVITVMTYTEYLQYHGLERRVVPLEYADASSISAVIKPFLSKVAKDVVHQETNTIALYEVEANIDSIVSIIEKLDIPSENIIVEVINLVHADSESVAKILQGVFNSKKSPEKNKAKSLKEFTDKTKQNPPTDIKTTAISLGHVEIVSVEHSNQLVIVGTKADIKKVVSVVLLIDVADKDTILEVIDLMYADAELVAETLKAVFSDKNSGKDGKSVWTERANLNKRPDITKIKGGSDLLSAPGSHAEVHSIGRSNQLIIKAYNDDLEKIKELIKKLDIFIEPSTQNYHFTYVDAAEIYRGLERILGIYSRGGGRGRQGSISSRNQDNGVTLIEKTNSILLTGPPSAHRIMTSIIETIDVPATYEAGFIRVYKIENADLEEVATTVKELVENRGANKEGTKEAEFIQDTSSGDGQTSNSNTTMETKEYTPQIEARVSTNKATNSLIIQATSRQHRELEKLIKELDVRRKQVLIKAIIIDVTVTDDLNLGVELNHASIDWFAFTSFGLSTINPITGVRDVVVSPGGTAALLKPDEAQGIIQMLKTDINAKVISEPQILVNDNAVGFINSISEEPITQVNASQTVATTSFAGFVEAGTEFAITPHISETDYLRIEYQITLNSFTGTSSDPSIPPPRNTTSIQSEATIPDGHTIIVGGLSRTDESESISKVPLLGDLPLIGFLFRNTVIKAKHTTTYLFITPTIMENRNFDDLKEASTDALEFLNGEKDLKGKKR